MRGLFLMPTAQIRRPDYRLAALRQSFAIQNGVALRSTG